MRGFIGFVVLALVGLAVLVFVVAPAVIKPMVVNAVHAALPFGDQPVQVDAVVTGLGLISGSIDSIHVTGTSLSPSVYAGVKIGRLDATISHASIGDHAFAGISGGLDEVTFPISGDRSVTVSQITFTGASDAVTGAATLQPKEAIALVTELFADAGISVENVQLQDNDLALTVFGQNVTFGLDVEGGALEVPDALGNGPITLLQPGPDDRWRLTGVSVTPGGIELDVVMDANALLSGG